MPETMTCKTKSAALAALGAISKTMQRGAQKDALLAIADWITETISDDILPGEVAERMRKIFEGSEWEQKGKAWIIRETEDPKYIDGIPASDGEHRRHVMINTPEDGSELQCFYCADTKQWEPIGFGWPPMEQKTDCDLDYEEPDR